MKNFSFIFLFAIISQMAIGQTLDNSFFDEADQFFKTHVESNNVNYAKAKSSTELRALVQRVANTDLSGANAETQKAFYINAYNILVVKAVAESFPIASVKDISGFFDKKKHTVAGESLTLNKLENSKLLSVSNDPRLHFVVVCGAVDCPPIVDFAYRPNELEAQLDGQTSKALNNPNFIKTTDNGIEISQIFNWYAKDFGGNLGTVRQFINKYRSTPISDSDKVSYYEYNWQLNDSGRTTFSNGGVGAANDSRYVVSATIPKGNTEIKLFNNLYTQQTGSNGNLTDRSTFFTSTFAALYGLTNRFNAGIEVKYRRVENTSTDNSAFQVFKSGQTESSRSGITGIGPKIRFAPFKSLSNFSIQSTLIFSTGDDLAGTNDLPYIDWNGPTFNTQLFNDFSIGNRFSLFTELDFLIEDIGARDSHSNRFSTPATLIFSYFPNAKTTLYTIGGFSPYYQTTFDYFIQGGVGGKYQINPNFEVELLYTAFTNRFLLDTGGNAQTFNLGIRYNL